MTPSQKKAYDAYWWLNDNHEWAVLSLDVSLSAVNPKTRKVDEDRKKNTSLECWLEAGPFHVDKKNDYAGFSHDYRLDCGGATFEEAIVKLARLVRRHYGKRSTLKGHKPRTT